MARKRRRASIPEATIFPFISVLLCTMGAMVLVWLSFSLVSSLTDPRVKAKADESEAANAVLIVGLAAGRAQIASLTELTTTVNQRLGIQASLLTTRHDELAAAQREQQLAAARVAAARAEVAVALDAEASLAALQQRRERAMATLQAEAQTSALQAVLAEVQQRQHDQDERRRQLAERQAKDAALQAKIAARNGKEQVTLQLPAGNTLQPVLVEIAAGGARLLATPGQPMTALDAALAADGQLRRAAVATAEGQSCLVLLVRPDGGAVARRLAGTLRDLRAVFTSEPVDATWDLTSLGGAP